jgi:hypothetical protein
MPDVYAARVVDIPDEGIRLEPTPDSAVPEQPNEVNLLGMAVALALGTAAYEHHPEPRDPQLQTIEALLAGDAVMPWRARRATGKPRDPRAVPYIVCERTGNVFKCAVQQRPADLP